MVASTSSTMTTATPPLSLTLDALAAQPNALAGDYSRFRVGERLLLTGHSHQAWPDRALDGQTRAFHDAAERVDEKWDRAFAAADRVRQGLAGMMSDVPGSSTAGTYALAANTHDLLIRFLSALPLTERPRLVTTDGEFHTIRRQLARLDEVETPTGERWLEIVRVAAEPASSVAERLIAEVDDSTSAVLASAVFFGSGRIAKGLGELAAACRLRGAELLVDAYHATGVVPLSIPGAGLGDAYLVGGGYKYLQMGEGNCWLRVPPGRAPRPIVTGWFAEFTALADARRPERVPYARGADAFAGATYDPTSHYRAAAVLDFWHERGLTPEFLRQVSQHQVGLLCRRFDDLDLDPSLVARDRTVPLGELGGFLALTTPHASALSAALRERGVATDFRGQVLRFGPAPYLSDSQLETAMGHLGEVASQLRG